MLRNKQPKPGRSLPGTYGQLGVGGAIGFLSGLVGAGGGFVSVPFMTLVQYRHSQRGGDECGLGLPHRGV